MAGQASDLLCTRVWTMEFLDQNIAAFVELVKLVGIEVRPQVFPGTVSYLSQFGHSV